MVLSSSPVANGEILHHGIHHLIEHNASIPMPMPQDEGIQMQSRYTSPADSGYEYQDQTPRYRYQQHQHQDSGLGIQYDNYNSDYPEFMYQSLYNTPATSPPTPSMKNEMLRTRSGLGIPRNHQNLRPMPDSRSRTPSSPKPKKAKKDKIKAEKKMPKLDKPLSELTKDWTHVAVVDIDAYVNRSVEVRRKEVEDGKIPGKVKRPMNSFMLYRKAYQNRTKDWCLQNNHQVVSQVCGESWPLEPDEVRDQFNEWARLERANHQNAHPGYKFSPAKPGASKTPKRERTEEISEESELDDFEWQAASKRGKKLRPSNRMDPQQPVAYPTTRSAYQYSSREPSMEPNQGGYIRSSYQANNPGQPLPVPYSQAGLGHGEYYEQTITNHPHYANVQDVILRKAAAPGMPPYLGLPGGQDIGGHFQQQYEMPMNYEQRLDPSLMQHDQSIYGHSNYASPPPHNLYFDGSQNGDIQWQAPYTMEEHDPIMPSIDPELHAEGMQIQEPHMHVQKGQQEGWQLESLDNGSEFDDKWMDKE